MRKVNKEILDDLVAAGFIDSYVLTEHYAAYAYSEEVDKHLEELDFNTNGEICCHCGEEELKICYLD